MRCIAACILLLTASCRALGQEGGAWLQWRELPSLPGDVALVGAFVGVSNGALIVAGGADASASPDGREEAYYDQIYVLPAVGQARESSWRDAGRLPFRVAHGAAITTESGVLCFGGGNTEELFDRVFQLTWDPSTNAVRMNRDFPAMPKACQHFAAAKLGQRIYIAGGRGENGALSSFWVLDQDKSKGRRGALRWVENATWPGLARYGAAMVAQSDGERDAIFLFGGESESTSLADAYKFDPARQRWTVLTTMPRSALHAAAVSTGNAHVLLFGRAARRDADESRGSTRFVEDVLAYNTITNAWSSAGAMPTAADPQSAHPLNGGWLIPAADVSSGLRKTRLLFATVPALSVRFGALDFTVLGLYLAILVGMGWYFSKREKTTADFFLAGGRIPWWAAGLSIMATQISAIGFMAIPAKTFATDWLYFAGVATWFIVVPVVTMVFIPFFRRLNVTSAYQYLEIRFSISIRLLAALLFSFIQLARVAIVLYLPALALSAVIGLDIWACIILMGLITTGYTVAGGMEAVVWTDVFQVIVLLGGATLCVVLVLLKIEGGVSQFVEIASSNHKFRLADFGWSHTAPVLWVILVGNTATRLSSLTSDQSIVQRYLCTPDVRQANRSLWADVAMSIPWALLIFLLGTVFYVFYKLHPEQLSPNVDVNNIVPFFIATNVPAGLSGLIIAAIFAASMSSFDSAVHSVATVATTDFYQRFRPAASDHSALWLARGIIAMLGVLATVAALFISAGDVKSIWDLFIEVLGLGIGVLAGLFMLGAFSRQGNTVGALVGAGASLTILVFLKTYSRTSFFLYPAIGIAGTWAIGYVVSLATRNSNPARGTARLIIPDVRATK